MIKFKIISYKLNEPIMNENAQKENMFSGHSKYYSK